VLAMLSFARLARLFVLMTCVVAPAALAKEPAPRVKVTVVTILAGDRGDDVDPRLKCVADEVRKLNPQLKSFKLVSMASRSLAVDDKAEFPLVDDQVAQVVIRQRADETNKISLAVTPPRQGEIVYRAACGKFLPIVTRYQTRENERLILAVRVQPCLGK
jgi:hypothetical protein